MAAAEDLKSSVREDVQVRILPPLPSPPFQIPAGLRSDQFAAYSYLLGMYSARNVPGRWLHLPRTADISLPRVVASRVVVSIARRPDVSRLDGLLSFGQGTDTPTVTIN